MPLNRIACPSCQAILKSAAGFTVGAKVKCPKCQTAFAVDEDDAAPEVAPPPRPASPAAKKSGTAPAAKKPGRPVAALAVDDDDEDDDRPVRPKKKAGGSGGKKKRRRRDEDDDEGGGYKNSPLRYAILGLLILILIVACVYRFVIYKPPAPKEVETGKTQEQLDKEEDARNAAPIIKDDRKPTGTPGNGKKTTFAPVGGGAFQDGEAMKNLKILAIGMLNYQDAQGTLPPPAIRSRGGKPLLSWRVAILPYIEHQPLYGQFKLDEPWDSAANKKVLAEMPKFFASGQPAGSGLTCYKVFAGGGAAFDPVKGRRLSDFTDGASNTLLIVQAGDPVPWTKPEDFEYDPAKPLPDLALPGKPATIPVVMADGAARRVSLKGVSEKTWRAAVSASGGDAPGADW